MLVLVLATIGCVLAREGQGVPCPHGGRGRIQARGWVLLLLPVAMAAAAMARGAHGLVPAELGIAALAIVFAPKLAARLVPFGVLGLAVFGVDLAKDVPRREHRAGSRTCSSRRCPESRGRRRPRPWRPVRGRPVAAAAADAPDAGLVRALAARWLGRRRGGISAAHGLLLIPVVGLSLQLLGPHAWFGRQVAGLDVALFDLAVATAALVLIFRSRAWAATLAAAGLLVLGAYGWLIAVFWPVPGFALALDAPLPVELDIDLPGEVQPPVASAVYFSVAEALANAAKHARARSVRIQLGHAAASATYSRTGCSTTRHSPWPSAPWPRAAPCSTPRWWAS